MHPFRYFDIFSCIEFEIYIWYFTKLCFGIESLPIEIGFRNSDKWPNYCSKWNLFVGNWAEMCVFFFLLWIFSWNETRQIYLMYSTIYTYWIYGKYIIIIIRVGALSTIYSKIVLIFRNFKWNVVKEELLCTCAFVHMLKRKEFREKKNCRNKYDLWISFKKSFFGRFII